MTSVSVSVDVPNVAVEFESAQGVRDPVTFCSRQTSWGVFTLGHQKRRKRKSSSPLTAISLLGVSSLTASVAVYWPRGAQGAGTSTCCSCIGTWRITLRSR